MEWLLGISVILNIIFSLLAGLFLYLKVCADNEAFHAQEGWAKWELRFYEAQGMLLEDHNLFIAPTMGEFGKMTIKDKNK